MSLIKTLIVNGDDLPEEMSDFGMIYEETKALCKSDYSAENVDKAMRAELASVCYRILENTAVFKDKTQTVEFMKQEVFGE